MHRIILIGLRASGKSSVGREVARLLGTRFTDLDDLVAQAARCANAGEAFQSLGERAFRTVEATELGALLKRDEGGVVALGGGTPTAPGCEAMLGDAAGRGWTIVLLDADDRCLGDRIALDGDSRPSVTGARPADEVAALRSARWPTLARLAHSTVVTAGRSVAQSAQAVVSGGG